ncbi:MAG: response regulator transcription factor, partial [Chloroflexota bacterium]
QFFGQQISILGFGHEQLGDGVLEGMISTELVRQEAEKRGQGAEIIATIQRLLDSTDTTIEREAIASTALIEPLTEREEQILRFIAAGLTNREIADQLTVAVGTVKTHAHNLYSKLGVSNRTEATSRAHELNLV